MVNQEKIGNLSESAEGLLPQRSPIFNHKNNDKMFCENSTLPLKKLTLFRNSLAHHHRVGALNDGCSAEFELIVDKAHKVKLII
jgi:hypothetical protein